MKHDPSNRLYSFTNAYQDQLEGAKGQTFLKRRFFEKLTFIQILSRLNYHHDLKHTKHQWMTQYKAQGQIDDMSIVGVQL